MTAKSKTKEIDSDSADIYVARLGIEKIEFESHNGTYVPMQFHTTAANINTGLASSKWAYTIPWQLSNEGTALNVDVSDGSAALPESSIYTETFYPKMTTATTPARSTHYNYPVCYVKNSKIKIKPTPSDNYVSHITGNASTGTIPAGTPDIFLKVKKKTTNAYGTEKTSSKITAGTTIELEMDDLVQNKVGNETLEFEYSWCYKDGTTEIPIPGSFTSTHKCYTIIDTPHSPWGIGTGTGAGETPWLAVVDASCKMAEGVTCSASDPKPLYVKMEKAINELEGSIDNVPSKLKYDVSGGKPNYVIENGVVVMPPLVTVGHFRPYPSGQLRLSNFLLFIKEDRSTNEGRLSGRTANMVNCSDCAFLLTTFANALGGDLRVAWITNYDSNYGLQGFTLNPIVPVGSDHFETIQFTPTGRFSYHAVSVPASTTAIPLDASTSVYDACLKLGIPDPTKKVNGGKVKEGDCKLSAGLPFDVPDNLQVVNIDGNLSGEINCNPVLGTVPDIFGINAKYEITVNNPATTCSIKRDDKVVDPHHNLSATRTTDGVNINFTAGTVSVGKKFSFDTQYNYNEYRALLSSPGNNGRGRCVWLHQKSITID